MSQIIRLTQVAKNNGSDNGNLGELTDKYVVFSTNPSLKLVQGKQKKVTPLTIVDMLGQDVLNHGSYGPTIFLGYDNLLCVDESLVLSSEFNMDIYPTKNYLSDGIFAFTVDSNILIESYRAINYLAGLQEIQGYLAEELVKAKQIVQDQKGMFPRDYQGDVILPNRKVDLVIADNCFGKSELLDIIKAEEEYRVDSASDRAFTTY